MSKFEDIQVGDIEQIKHKITEKDIDRFVELTGDDNKLHVDETYAETTPFKKPVVHGMLSASFISTIIGTKIPGDGALWISQNLDFLLPARIGDEITIKAEVIKKIERQQIVEIKTEIYNQHKQKVIDGTARVKIIEVEPKEKEKEEKEQPVAVIIGATGGIGSASSIRLAKDGFDIVLHYHSNKTKALELKAEIEKLGRKALLVSGDINDFQQVSEMVEEVQRDFKHVSALINCTTTKIANIKFDNIEWSDIQKHIDINLKGSFNLIKGFLSLLEKSKGRKVINITTLAIETPNTEWLHYITAKSALHGFSKALAMDLAPKGIRVNMVSPGMTDTELIADVSEKARLLTAAKTPLRRLAKPDDIASAISFLASDKADFLTGETIRVNGGQVML